jgi:MFS family permease
MIVGFVSIGWLTQWLGKRDISTTQTAVTGMSLFMFAQLQLIILPITVATPVWVLFGFTGTAGIIAYAALSQSFPSGLSGRVTTAINLLVFVTAFCTQWLVGWVIDFFTPETSTILAVQGFQWSFSLLLLLQLFGLLFFFVTCRKSIDVR